MPTFKEQKGHIFKKLYVDYLSFVLLYTVLSLGVIMVPGV